MAWFCIFLLKSGCWESSFIGSPLPRNLETMKINANVFTEYANRVINIMEKGSNRKLRKVITYLFSKDLFVWSNTPDILLKISDFMELLLKVDVIAKDIYFLDMLVRIVEVWLLRGVAELHLVLYFKIGSP